jgi:hypothetical protein
MLETRWNKGWGKLQQFVAREGYAAVPDYHVEDGFRLGAWVSELHDMKKHWKTLPQKRIDELDSLDDWQWSWLGVADSEHNRNAYAHLESRRAFLEMSTNEQAALVYDGLASMSVLNEADALKHVADHVGLSDRIGEYDLFLADTERVDAVNGAIEAAVELGYLDRPLPGTLRGVMTTPEDFCDEAWSMSVFMVLKDRPLRQGKIIERATGWAVENCGLVCDELAEIGKVRECLAEAIRIDIVRREIEELSGGVLRSCC